MLLISLQAMSGSLLLECSAVLRQQGFLDPSAKLLDEHQALAGQHSEVNKQARLRLLLSQASWAYSSCFSGVLEVTQSSMKVICFMQLLTKQHAGPALWGQCCRLSLKQLEAFGPSPKITASAPADVCRQKSSPQTSCVAGLTPLLLTASSAPAGSPICCC